VSRILTYDETAEAFGISRRSAAQLVRRRRWPRRKGNDGRARIEVPDDAFLPPSDTPSDTLSDAASEGASDTSSTPSEAPSDRLSDTLFDTPSPFVERLLAELAELRPKVAVLAALLEAEKRRADELRQERDRWATQAHALAHAPSLPPLWWSGAAFSVGLGGPDRAGCSP
jgi:hypothetical protein